MADFIVKIKKGIKIEQEVISATNIEDAKKTASTKGKLVSIKKKRTLSPIMSPGMKSHERIIFLRRMAMMARSRIGAGQALDLMRTEFKGAISKASNNLYNSVNSGADFGKSIMEMRNDFPEATASLINAGIRAGNLYMALIDGANFEVEMDAIKKKSTKGILPALITFIVSILLTFSCSYFLGPYVMESDLIVAAGDSVNIDWVFTLGDIISVIMIVIMIIGFLLFFLAFFLKPLFPKFSDRIILKIPMYRDIILNQGYYITFYSMSLLARSGIRMDETLRITADSAPKGVIKNDVLAALEAVKQGKSWPRAMKNLHPTDIAALSTSFDRDQIATSLDAVSTQYKESYQMRIEQILPIIQTFSALFMSLAGGLIFAMVILPMLQMTKGIMQMM